MPIIPLFAFIGQTATTAEVVARFNTFYRTHTTARVAVEIKSNMNAYNGSGTISMARPGMRVEVHAQNLGYVLVVDGKNGIEAIPSEKSYAEFGVSPDIGKIPFRLSETMADYNLDPFLTGSIGEPGNWQSVAKGAMGDVLMAHSEDQLGITDTELEIDPEGKIVRIKSSRIKGRSGPPKWIETTFKNYDYRAISARTFSMDPDPGWNAVGLRLASMPIQPEEKLHDHTLTQPDGGKASLKDLIHGKTVIALLDKEWADGPYGTEALPKIEKQFKDAGIPLVRLADEAGVTARGYWSDPTGDLLQELNAQGSPCFFLFDKDAKLLQAFFAYSPREPEALYKDIADKLKELAD